MNLKSLINNEDLYQKHFAFIKGEAFDVFSFIKNNISEIKLIESVMPDNISGFIKKKDNIFYICVNQYHSFNRKRFTVAHELGHYFRHREEVEKTEDGLIDVSGGDIKNTIPRTDDIGERENEANEFAAELLMPEERFKKYWIDTKGNISEIAKIFIVSESAVFTRAKLLQLLNKDFVGYFF